MSDKKPAKNSPSAKSFYDLDTDFERIAIALSLTSSAECSMLARHVLELGAGW